MFCPLTSARFCCISCVDCQISDNEIINEKDIARLCSWNCITDDELNEVFRRSGNDCSDKRRRAAMHLIRWCLQGNPGNRPTLAQVLEHPFLHLHVDVCSVDTLYAEEFEPLPSAIDQTKLAPIKTRNVARMVYHVFISHNQTEVCTQAHVHACTQPCLCTPLFYAGIWRCWDSLPPARAAWAIRLARHERT